MYIKKGRFNEKPLDPQPYQIEIIFMGMSG